MTTVKNKKKTKQKENRKSKTTLDGVIFWKFNQGTWPKSRVVHNGTMCVDRKYSFIFIGVSNGVFHKAGHSEGGHESIWGYMTAENICK